LSFIESSGVFYKAYHQGIFLGVIVIEVGAAFSRLVKPHVAELPFKVDEGAYKRFGNRAEVESVRGQKLDKYEV
jgi:hypothetical protein